MKNKKSLLSVALVALILVLGVGYAIVSSVGLSINGTAGTLTDETDLNVIFTDIADQSDNFIEDASFNGTSASFTIKDLSRVGDGAEILYTVTNQEEDINANLGQLVITNSNPDYFTVSAYYQGVGVGAAETYQLDAGKSVNVDLVVSLKKTPTTHQTATIKVDFVASPIAQ